MIHSIKSGVLLKGCFLSNFGNQKISLWPPVIEQKAPNMCEVLGCFSVLLESINVSLALFGEGNVISIVLLKKCAESAFLSFFFVRFEFCLLFLYSFFFFLHHL